MLALITGVGRKVGIGAAIAQGLAEAGYQLALSYHPKDDESQQGLSEPQQIVNDLRTDNIEVQGFAVDLSEADAAAILMRNVNTQMGMCTVLVNNAAHSTSCTLDELTAEVLDAHYAVNTRGTALLCKAFADQYEDAQHNGQARGRVINLTSGQGLGAMPTELAYAASKGAVDALTVSLNVALAPYGITINAIDPGATDTGWMGDELQQDLLNAAPLGRLGQPVDAANLVRFLASSESGWISGQVLRSRGGL
ncbi:MAG: SDR family oxidoreductase [Deinococcota bacterium]